MCFKQGKPCIYMTANDKYIVSEFVNGVIDIESSEGGPCTRTWPDGRIEQFPEDTKEVPYIPRGEGVVEKAIANAEAYTRPRS